MKKALRYLLYLFYLLLFVEVALRVGAHFVNGTSLWDLRRFRSDPYVFWKFNPGFQGPLWTYRQAKINQSGFLGKDLEESRGPQMIRLVALGGSVVFGCGVEQVEDNFCSQLERLLNNPRAGRCEVVNAGVPGYSSWNGRQFVEHYLADLQPDVLLVAFGWNDTLLDYFPDGDPRQRQQSACNLAEEFPYNQSALAHSLRRMALTIGIRTGLRKEKLGESERETRPPRVSVEDFRGNLAFIRDWCAQHEVKLIFCTESEARLERGEVRRTRLHAQYLAAMRAVAAELSVPLADVALAFSQMDPDSLFAHPEVDYVHPDRRGQAEMARLVFQKLEEAGYLGEAEE